MHIDDLEGNIRINGNFEITLLTYGPKLKEKQTRFIIALTLSFCCLDIFTDLVIAAQYSGSRELRL